MTFLSTILSALTGTIIFSNFSSDFIASPDESSNLAEGANQPVQPSTNVGLTVPTTPSARPNPTTFIFGIGGLTAVRITATYFVLPGITDWLSVPDLITEVVELVDRTSDDIQEESLRTSIRELIDSSNIAIANSQLLNDNRDPRDQNLENL